MAMMFPADAEGFTTAGEGFFYGLLDSVLLPDSDFLAWYEPRLNGALEPDFVIYEAIIDSVKRLSFSDDYEEAQEQTSTKYSN